MNAVATQPHVTLSGDIIGEYVIEEERPDGRLVLAPDTSWRAIRERMGASEPTPNESADFWREHGPHMGPPDGEG
jgi:hypothetical protein